MTVLDDLKNAFETFETETAYTKMIYILRMVFCPRRKV